jgi:polyisoprenoid-binding protein YceI
MKKINALFAALLIAGSAFAQTWSLDKSHSNMNFTVTHLVVSEVDGSFKTFDAKITSSKDDFSDAVIEFTADAASIFTNNDRRDQHLRSADFFDAEKFPTVTFKSKSIKKVDGKKYKVTGDLTLRGVTKSVELDFTLNGITENRGKKVAGIRVSGSILRSDFGIGAGSPTAVVGDEVSFLAKGEFTKD